MDIDELNSSTIFMVSCPVVATFGMYCYKKLQESGGASSSIAHAISLAKNKFSDSEGGKWKGRGGYTKKRNPNSDFEENPEER